MTKGLYACLVGPESHIPKKLLWVSEAPVSCARPSLAFISVDQVTLSSVPMYCYTDWEKTE